MAAMASLLLPPGPLPQPLSKHRKHPSQYTPLHRSFNHASPNNIFTASRQNRHFTKASKSTDIEGETKPSNGFIPQDLECIGTGTDVECVIPMKENNVKRSGIAASRAIAMDNLPQPSDQLMQKNTPIIYEESLSSPLEPKPAPSPQLGFVLETLLLISPFFFWGTAMVAMKGILPKAGPLFVASTRLIPAGLLLIAYASSMKREQPKGISAWVAITVFALIDATCFQGFLAEGLKRTSAGLGSVIIDSQPLTVAILASILFGESIKPLGVLGLLTGVIGLLLLEVPPQVFSDFLNYYDLSLLISQKEGASWSLWESGEWWMLLAAQSMAVGTVLVRWVCQYSDPIMATGWHMVVGGIPLLVFSVAQQDPAVSGHIQDLQFQDWMALLYTSFFGSAISYGVFFYNATRGSLTKLSSLTFLTPMFAAIFGYLYLDETLTPLQLSGALTTIVSIYLVNTRVNEGNIK